MPYKSKAQQRFFHANRDRLEKEGVNVREWDRATGDSRLPERLGKSKGHKLVEKLARAMSGKKK